VLSPISFKVVSVTVSITHEDSLLLDNFWLDKSKTGDALLFKGFGVYSTGNVLS